MKSSVTVVHDHPRLHSRQSLVLSTTTLLTNIYTHTLRTTEVSCHLFIQAVELLSVFESGGMWHSPVAGNCSNGGHHRGG